MRGTDGREPGFHADGASPLPRPALTLIEAPDATSGTVGGMSSLTIRPADRAPFFRGSVEGGGGAEQI
jgi:hypothetical protein